MIRRSPVRLIAAANSYIGAVSEGPLYIRGGLADDANQPSATGEERTWDALLLHRWGFWSHFDHVSEASSWPLPRAANAQELGDIAAVHRALHETPVPGDVFLQYSPIRRAFVRAGVVALVVHRGMGSLARPYADVVSVEAQTDHAGTLGGPNVLRVRRRLSASNGDRFLRWWTIDASSGARDPEGKNDNASHSERGAVA